MDIKQLLIHIRDVAEQKGLSKPYIVGGIPRDRVLGILGEKTDVNDLDITTGDEGSAILGKLLYGTLKDSVYRMYDDGHSSLDYRGIHIDFSSHFVVNKIDAILKTKNVEDITPMKRELYSRDFFFNTLLQGMDMESIYDLTGEAIGDLKAKIIRCPIDPAITIGSDPRRILRAIKYAVKYNFAIEDGLKNIIFEKRKLLQSLPPKSVQDKISEIVLIDADRGIDMLIEYKILPLVPLTKMVYDTLIQKRKLVKAL
jgi:tRNA nucleotidyltransferase/poly(A) polymerase